MVLKHESQGNLTHCELSDSPCGIKMYGRSYARVRHNSLQRHSEAHILVTDGAEVRASYNGIISGRGSGVQASRCARCILSHNNIMCNQGMGVDASDRVLLEMRANRVSANGQYGVRVDAACCRLKANVIFGNQFAGLFLLHTSHALVHGLSSSSSCAGAIPSSSSLLLPPLGVSVLLDRVFRPSPGRVSASCAHRTDTAGPALSSWTEFSVLPKPCCPRLHYRLLTLCPTPTDPVGQSWPRGKGSVGRGAQGQ